MTELLKCRSCDNDFPSSDRRAFFHPARPDLATCPLCHVLGQGSPAWAIANDCNGIFETEIYSTKAAAVAECAKPNWQGDEVIAVTVIRVPNDETWRRDYEERDRTVSAAIDRKWP